MKLNLRAIDLNLLPVFVAVVEAGQLSKAAENLNMSQPAVSAALQRLRLTVNDELFNRTRSGLKPTPRAQDLYRQISGQLELLSSALDPSQQFDISRSDRTFRLLSPDYFESLILGSLIHQIRETSPGISIQMLPDLNDWDRLLLEGKADFAMDTQIPEDERLEAMPILEESLAVVARNGHPHIKGTLTLDQFLEAEHVVLPPRDRQTLPLDRLLGKPGWRRRTGAQVVHLSNLMTVASASDLIATVPWRMAEQFKEALGLQVLPFPVEAPPVLAYLIWPKVLSRDPAHQWFRSMLEQEMIED